MIRTNRALIAAPGSTSVPFSGLADAVRVREVKPGEDVFQYVNRVNGGFDQTLYQRLIGAANPYKEGDEAIGVAAEDETSRENARRLLTHTKIRDVHENPLYKDAQQELIWKTTDNVRYDRIKHWTLGELKEFLLAKTEFDIQNLLPGLNSDVIGCVVKLMSNDELIQVGQTVFHPLPGSQIGAKDYMGARIQPNSPTDNIDDLVWQVFNGWSFAVGDVLLGANPVDSTVENIANLERALAMW